MKVNYKSVFIDIDEKVLEKINLLSEILVKDPNEFMSELLEKATKNVVKNLINNTDVKITLNKICINTTKEKAINTICNLYNLDFYNAKKLYDDWYKNYMIGKVI